MSTTFRNHNRQQNATHPDLVDQSKNFFSSIAYDALFDKHFCESDGQIKGRVCEFRAKIPKIYEAKKKEGFSVGLQITQIFEDQDFNLLTPWCRVLLEKLTGVQLVKRFLNTNLNSTERGACKAF